MEEADIVVWVGGVWWRGEREGSGWVFVEDVGGVDGEVGRHFCVG